MRDYFKETMLYGSNTLSLEEVQVAMSSKELNKKFDVKVSCARGGLVARGYIVITKEVERG